MNFAAAVHDFTLFLRTLDPERLTEQERSTLLHLYTELVQIVDDGRVRAQAVCSCGHTETGGPCIYQAVLEPPSESVAMPDLIVVDGAARGPVRPLNATQAASCEKAAAARCRCRCGGSAHGAAQMVEAEREFFEQLPVEDPHHIPEHRQMRLPKEYLPVANRVDALVSELNQIPGVHRFLERVVRHAEHHRWQRGGDGGAADSAAYWTATLARTSMSTTSAEPLHAQLADMRKRIQRLEDIALLLANEASRGQGSTGKLYWEFIDDITADRGLVETRAE